MAASMAPQEDKSGDTSGELQLPSSSFVAVTREVLRTELQRQAAELTEAFRKAIEANHSMPARPTVGSSGAKASSRQGLPGRAWTMERFNTQGSLQSGIEASILESEESSPGSGGGSKRGRSSLLGPAGPPSGSSKPPWMPSSTTSVGGELVVPEEMHGHEDEEPPINFLHRHRRTWMSRDFETKEPRAAPSEGQGFNQQDSFQSGKGRNSKLSIEWEPPAPAASWPRRMVKNRAFDVVVLVTILVNVIAVGIQTDILARSHSPNESMAFRVIERCTCCVFLFEMVMRFLASTDVHSKDINSLALSAFDFFLIIVQVADVLIQEAISVGHDHILRVIGRFTRVLRVLRITRLLRIIRIARNLQCFREIRTIVVSIVGTLRTLLWTLLLLLVIIFMLAVALTQVVANHFISNPSGSGGDQRLQQYWGDVLTSMLVLFQSLTNGLDWGDALVPLMEDISHWLVIPLVLYAGFGLFALMNVVTSIFVEAGLESTRNEKERFLLHTISKLFTLTDEDGSGDISWTEFQAKLDSPAMQLYFKTCDLDIKDAEELFRLIDIDSSGSIDPEEFVNGCLRLQGPAKAIDLAALMSEFKRTSSSHIHRFRKLRTQLLEKEQLDVRLAEVGDESKHECAV